MKNVTSLSQRLLQRIFKNVSRSGDGEEIFSGLHDVALIEIVVSIIIEFLWQWYYWTKWYDIFCLFFVYLYINWQYMDIDSVYKGDVFRVALFPRRFSIENKETLVVYMCIFLK